MEQETDLLHQPVHQPVVGLGLETDLLHRRVHQQAGEPGQGTVLQPSHQTGLPLQIVSHHLTFLHLQDHPAIWEAVQVGEVSEVVHAVVEAAAEEDVNGISFSSIPFVISMI
jgi:hypothetical protein